jgi:hypothetical protein
MIDPAAKWKEVIGNLPPVNNPATGALNVANAINDRIFPSTALDTIGIQTNSSSIIGPTGNAIIFTFNSVSFAAALSGLPPTNSRPTAISTIATAWESAVLSSIIAPNGVGIYIPPIPLPTTIFSVVTFTVDPASVALGKSKILEFSSEPPESDKLPELFREAFLQLKVNAIGLDSTTPTPLPLQVLGVPLL